MFSRMDSILHFFYFFFSFLLCFLRRKRAVFLSFCYSAYVRSIYGISTAYLRSILKRIFGSKYTLKKHKNPFLFLRLCKGFLFPIGQVRKKQPNYFFCPITGNRKEASRVYCRFEKEKVWVSNNNVCQKPI